MAIYDFLIFAGPLFLYLFIRLIKTRNKNINELRIKNIALIILLSFLAINSNGPGEVSRPWGSLFILIAFFWIPELFSNEKENTRWLLIRAQLAWALMLQTFINFSW